MSNNHARIAILIVGSSLILSGAGLRAQTRSAYPVMGVSPGSVTEATKVAGSCPTFSWSGTDEAEGYEVVVYRLTEAGTLENVLEVQVPGRAAGSWTPGATQCLDSGSRYTWAVRAQGEAGPGPWSDLLQFQTAGLPSEDEVRAALETLGRYRAAREGDRQPTTGRAGEPGRAGDPQPRTHNPQPGGRGNPDGQEAALSSPTVSAVPSPQAVTTPASFSLNLDGDLSLGGSLFKDGYPLLHNDQSPTHYNTAVGFNALPATTPSGANGVRNTAVGHEALELNTDGFRNTATGFRALSSNLSGHRNTADGHLALFTNTTGFRNTALGNRALFSNEDGYANVAVGDRAMQLNESGHDNTAVGYRALHSNTSGNRNTAIGYGALFANTSSLNNTAIGHWALYSGITGISNTAIGYAALFNNTGVSNTAIGRGAGSNWTTGSSNIAIGIGTSGSAGESNVIRIGGFDLQNQTFIEGIFGATASGGSQVFINSSNQLGTATSSARFKQDIHDLEGVSNLLLNLRPVSFRYRDDLVNLPEGEDNPIEYGLVAEEVAEVFPELVSYDEQGRPFTVRYHLLTPLLLAEIQRQDEEIERLRGLEKEVADLRRRVERAVPRKRWWRK